MRKTTDAPPAPCGPEALAPAPPARPVAAQRGALRGRALSHPGGGTGALACAHRAPTSDPHCYPWPLAVSGAAASATGAERAATHLSPPLFVESPTSFGPLCSFFGFLHSFLVFSRVDPVHPPMRDFLRIGAQLEVFAEGDWWEARAVAFNENFVRVSYVGGACPAPCTLLRHFPPMLASARWRVLRRVLLDAPADSRRLRQHGW